MMREGEKMQKCGVDGYKRGKYVERWYNYGGVVWKRTFTLDHDIAERAEARGDVAPEARLYQNVRRAIRTVEEIALCNPWEWWVTFTLDKEKIDRYNVERIKKAFTKWFQNQRRNYSELKYLLVPEMHRDGAWHLHGFLMGLPREALRDDWRKAFKRLPNYIREEVKKGNEIYWWDKAFKKFGYCTLEPIRSKVQCAKYCAKYMNKVLYTSEIASGKALFMASQGLKRAERVEAREVPEDVVMTSGYLWDAGAAYWYERWNPHLQEGKLVDYSLKTVQIP